MILKYIQNQKHHQYLLKILFLHQFRKYKINIFQFFAQFLIKMNLK